MFALLLAGAMCAHAADPEVSLPDLMQGAQQWAQDNLDTNGWLATHVVGEALGYSAMFLAGLIGIIYIFRGVFTTSFDEVTSSQLVGQRLN